MDLHWVVFQLLDPIGGVNARPLSSARAAGAVARTPATASPATAPMPPIVASTVVMTVALRGLRTASPPGRGCGSGGSAGAEPVDVRPTGSGGGGGPDDVGAGREGRRDGPGGPGVPATGDAAGDGTGTLAVDRDGQRTAGGRAVGVPDGEGDRTGGGAVDGPLDVPAGRVGVVDEPGTGEAGVVGCHGRAGQRAVLRLEPVRRWRLHHDLPGVVRSEPRVVDPDPAAAVQVHDLQPDVRGLRPGQVDDGHPAGVGQGTGLDRAAPAGA